jgi:hypothetical protein
VTFCHHNMFNPNYTNCDFLSCDILFYVFFPNEKIWLWLFVLSKLWLWLSVDCDLFGDKLSHCVTRVESLKIVSWAASSAIMCPFAKMLFKCTIKQLCCLNSTKTSFVHWIKMFELTLVYMYFDLISQFVMLNLCIPHKKFVAFVSSHDRNQ